MWTQNNLQEGFVLDQSMPHGSDMGSDDWTRGMDNDKYIVDMEKLQKKFEQNDRNTQVREAGYGQVQQQVDGRGARTQGGNGQILETKPQNDYSVRTGEITQNQRNLGQNPRVQNGVIETTGGPEVGKDNNNNNKGNSQVSNDYRIDYYKSGRRNEDEDWQPRNQPGPVGRNPNPAQGNRNNGQNTTQNQRRPPVQNQNIPVQNQNPIILPSRPSKAYSNR